MAKKAENGKITKIEKPYGGSTVKERKAAMSRGLTEEELKLAIPFQKRIRQANRIASC